jgi:hypothetical protein
MTSKEIEISETIRLLTEARNKIIGYNYHVSNELENIIIELNRSIEIKN